MSILNVENVSHGFGSRKILENASFRLLKGEHVGLVGANGEGKTTFLNIITGKLMPDQGKIEWCSRITTGYLDQHSVLQKGKTIREILREAFQHMFDLEQEMLRIYEKMADAADKELNAMMEDVGEIQSTLEYNGFYTIDAKIEEVANGLGLGSIGLDREVDQLSGGQRSKVLLTKLLLQNPMILILDEPTNFLDDNHIAWLKNFLKNYENSFIMVSHDIPFLNDVVNVVYHVENAELTRYPGNYDQFMKMYELKKQQNQQAYEKQQKEIERLEDFIARNKARVATTNMAKSRQKQLDKMDMIEKNRVKVKPQFKFKEARTPGRMIFQAVDLMIGYGEPLTRPLTIALERGQKVAVKGVNGLGKSTLLKTLLGVIQPVSGDVELDPYLYPGYYEQEAACDNNNTAMEEIWNEYPGMTNYEVRNALAKCGLTTEHIESQMIVLSGGENAKVRLCKLMLKDVNWLILDEPTNHLDVEAKEELKKALKEFKGTVLLVSHEPEFYEDWVTGVWNVEEWTTKVI
jgi:ATPase subunit of ABC transporter with duplicated ATPase domains